MSIQVNGERQDLAPSLAELLVRMELAEAVVATAVNGVFVPVSRRGDTLLTAGDTVEVLAPMQGG